MNRLLRAYLHLTVLGAVLSAAPPPARAQAPESPDTPPLRDSGSNGLFGIELIDDRSVYFGDFKRFMTAPARWSGREWAMLGGVLAATRVAYEYDYDVREHFVPEPREHDYHDVEDFVPVALMFGGTWWSARRSGNDERFVTAQNMLRAGVLSTLSTGVLKFGFGRERPDEGVERDDWWSGGRSMPSGHTALAFAIGTVFAESGTPKRRWVRRVLGYGLGTGMIYLRLKHDSHWFSDTVPGAALGIAAGRSVLRHDAASVRRAQFSVAPLDGGALLSFSLTLD